MVSAGIRLLLVLAAAWSAVPGGVAARDDTAELRIEIAERKTPAIAGEMILVTVVGTYDVPITLEKLVLPRVEGFDWIQLANDEWSKERIGGRSLQIMRRQIAVFPKSDGVLEIGPFVQNLTIAKPDGGRSELKIVAPATTLTVTPYPGPSGSWPLSARKLEYTDTWDKDPATLADGQTATRTVTLTALGILPENLPPQPAMRARWLITFAPPETRSLELTPEGPVASVTWTWKMRPVTGEPGVLAGVQLPWFDTDARVLREIKLVPEPFGYASFAANRSALSRGGNHQGWVLALATLAGFAVASLLLFAGLRAGGRNWLNRLGVRARKHGHWRAMKRAERSGDLAALRAAALNYTGAAIATGGPQVTAAMNDLDRALYARPEPGMDFDSRDFLRTIAGR